MGIQSAILDRLKKGPVYADGPRDFARSMDIDPTREVLTGAVGIVLGHLIDDGQVVNDRDLDDPSADPKLGGKTVDVYRLASC